MIELYNTLTSNKQRGFRSMLPNGASKSNRYSNVQPLYNYLTLDFKQDRSTFGSFRSSKLHEGHNKHRNIFFKTFYSKQTPKSQRRQVVKSSNGRSTSMTNRDSVIGTPFRSVQFNDPEHQNSIFTSLDVQRYKYLLKAISRISKTKNLPQFKQQTSVIKSYEKIRQKSLSPACEKAQNKVMGSPKLVKLQIGFQDHPSPSLKGKCQNAFQKMFKNKQLLQRGRQKSSRSDAKEDFNLKLLGQEDLLVMQMTKQPRKQKRTLVL